MMPLTPDKIEKINGVTVKQYYLTKHNVNKISMPTTPMVNPIGVTIHNTDSINVASNTTPAEQYTRATVNGNMGTVRVHFYVDDTCAWQNLPLSLSGWHAADGNGNGNRKTISFEVIGNSPKAEADAIKLAAYYLKECGKTADNGLFTHTYWLNVRDGKSGSIDYLNTLAHPYKVCPVYIIPHWYTFKANVKSELEKLNGTDTKPIAVPSQLFRIRKSWEDIKSQIGAYSSLEKAIKAWKEGYFIYNASGEQVYPELYSEKTVEVPVEIPVQQSIQQKVDKPAQQKVEEKITVTYRANIFGKWLPPVSSDGDYAGVPGQQISALAVKVSKGKIRYRVRQRNSYWMKWITDYNISNVMTGCAGMPGIPIDAIQMEYDGEEGYDVKYRVAAIGQDYYPWVYGKEGNNGFAGSRGKFIDRIQIEIVKE